MRDSIGSRRSGRDDFAISRDRIRAGRSALSASTSRLALIALLGAGASSLAFPALAANFNVNNSSDLANAINNAKRGDAITFTSNITLSTDLPNITRSITLNGAGFSLDGANRYRGLILGEKENATVSSTIAINNLNIVNTIAKGGDGGPAGPDAGGGGGGAGLGGALLVMNGATVTATNLTVAGSKAQGGAGGGTSASYSDGGGGGGGWQTNGKGSAGLSFGGHGGLPGGGDGGNASYRPQFAARPGGFGGGGGGSGSGGSGGLIHGGGFGANGGFGGGGGGGDRISEDASSGGLFGGTGVASFGGGGAGLGGAIFVQDGGSLTFAGNLNISGGSALGGFSGAIGDPLAQGAGVGSGIFLMAGRNATFSPAANVVESVGDAIGGSGGVILTSGAGRLILGGANTYSGGTYVYSGVLQGSTTSLSGNIFNNASLVFNQNFDGVSAANISGSGNVIKSGSGAVTLGSAAYTGSTTVNGGVLRSTGLVATSGFILDGGLLAGNIDKPVTIGLTPGSGFTGQTFVSGAVSGGKLIISGADTSVHLDGNNTFSGAEIDGGLLFFKSDANLGKAGEAITLNGGDLAAEGLPPSVDINRSLVLAANGGIQNTSPLSWSGVISGSGQFIKTGVGTLTLSGANTYSGGTLVSRGFVSLAADVALGQAGTLVTLQNGTGLRATDTFETSRPFAVDGAALILINPSKTLTINGAVSGGTLIAQGDGTLVLNGPGSFAKLAVVGGTVIGNAATLGAGGIALTSGAFPATIVFDQRFDGTFGGNITGGGSLLKTNVGALTLTGTNTYSRGTTVQGGSLVGTSDSLQGNIINNGLVAFDQPFDGKYSGNLTGPGTFNKAGVGKLNITGNDQAGNGANINGGTLAVNGRLDSGVVVNDGGTLAGSGLVTGKVTLNGGKDDRKMSAQVAPGNSIGTLHILGDLTMAPASDYQVQINGASSDDIQVTGTATIQSSTFEIERYNTGASPVVPGKTYTILTTTDGLSVVSPTVAIADFPFISFALSEDGFNGYLTTSRSAERFAELASTPNEAAVANALDSATSSLAWQQVVGASASEAQAAFSSLSNASIHASAAGVLSEQSHFLRDAVLDRLRQDFPMTDSPAPADGVFSYVGGAPAAPAALPTKKAPAVMAPLGPVYAVWAQGLGSWGSLSGNSNVARTNDSIGGVISGIDVTFNRMFRLGFAGGYSQSNFNAVNIPASGSADSYHFAVYGGWQEGPWAVRGGGSVSWNDLNTSRQVTAVALGGQQTSSYADKTWQGFVEGARNFAFGPAALEPFANVAYVHVGGDVSESGLAAISGSTSFNTTYTTLGAHGSYILPAGLTAQATLGWRYAFGDVTPMSTLAFQSGGAAFALAGSPIARNALITELGVNYAIGPSATIGIAYSGQYSSGANENSGKANLTLRF
jgi:autotransporter-associated beta strand protein